MSISEILAPVGPRATPPKVGFVSLGCPKALTDSELILTQLCAEGYQTSKSFEGADLVIVNTCGFIDDAVKESLDTIGEALAVHGKVIVTGCLGARDDEQGGNLVRNVHPSVLAVTGPHATQEVMDAVHLHLPKPHDPFVDLMPAPMGVAGIKLTPRHYAYLKISEGCNNRCSFCIIPSLRGDLASRPVASVLYEAERLVKAGVQELLVISQDTSAYGMDIKYATSKFHGREIEARFLDMSRELGNLGAWVRLHYVYPYPQVDHVIPLMAEGKVLPYLDIPFQHASPNVLKAMRRPANQDKVLDRIHNWRKICPDLALRSTFIVGFPGETEADFEELLSWIKEARIERAGCFKYEPVEGAKANEIAGAVPEDVKEDRWHRFMAAQQAISAEIQQGKVGRTIEVLVDEIDEENDEAIARSVWDAPEIDGNVFLPGATDLKPGDKLKVKIVEAEEYDLIGQRLP